MERIAYPGSFRPFHDGHLSVVREIKETFPEYELLIGVAGKCERADHLISPNVAVSVVSSYLGEVGINDVMVKLVDIPNNPTLEWASDLLNAYNIVKVFTGSQKTINILSILKENNLWLGDIYKLDNSGIHASQLRKWITDGNEVWKEHVSLQGVKIISNQVV